MAVLSVARLAFGSGPDEARDRVGGFLDLGGRVTGPRGVDDAVREMVLEQPDGDSLQGALGGGDLGQDIDAVRVLVDHPLQPADLPLDAPQPAEQGGLVARSSRAARRARAPRSSCGQHTPHPYRPYSPITRGFWAFCLVIEIRATTLTARALAVALLSALLLTGPAAFASPLEDKPTAAELDKQIAAAARQLEVIVEQYNNSREDLLATRERTSSLGVALRPLTRALATRQALMDDLMSRTYQRTRTGPTVTLLASANPHEFVDKLLILNQLATSSRKAAQDLRRARADVVGTRTTLERPRRPATHACNSSSSPAKPRSGRDQHPQANASPHVRGGSRFGPPRSHPGRPTSPARRARGRLRVRPARQAVPWGADGPNSYDCSGLTMAAWQQAGINLPHNAARQYGSLPHVSRSDLRPGDLVFFYGTDQPRGRLHRRRQNDPRPRVRREHPDRHHRHPADQRFRTALARRWFRRL